MSHTEHTHGPTGHAAAAPHEQPLSREARGWAIALVLGLALGTIGALALPQSLTPAGSPDVPLWLIAPFALLLLLIAVMPLVASHWWHANYPRVALLLGGLVAAYYALAFRGASGGALATAWPGVVAMEHALVEYVAFFALVGGLYVASAGIVVDLGSRASPATNTATLALGAVLANLVGTTGASVLLIRPFMRANHGRLRPLHVVFFIFIVSNCGGSLTPIGDPPLYLGFIKGVPFFWTLPALWKSWALVVALLLAMYYAYDRWLVKHHHAHADDRPPATTRFAIRARPLTLLLGALMVACVFVDPLLARHAGIKGVPVGAILQIALAIASFATAPKDLVRVNGFTFEPVKEVGLLFLGIFATMVPALAYLAQHGGELGIATPTTFYFATGGLSAVLDNAPTYLNFLQVALAPAEVGPAAIGAMLSTPEGNHTLLAISTGAVFFGAMTYIGNGPNFMVRSIAQASGVRMPSFFAYAAWACAILLPVLIVHWLALVR
jgi:Na+/H+ antiporter NhaD/arsenite permease-like protein